MNKYKNVHLWLILVFIIVLLVIYAMIATQLRCYLQPLAILVSIPLGSPPSPMQPRSLRPQQYTRPPEVTPQP